MHVFEEMPPGGRAAGRVVCGKQALWEQQTQQQNQLAGGISHHCTGEFLIMLTSGSQHLGFDALELLNGV